MAEEIRFYGKHYPEHVCFSNFYIAPFQLDGKNWETTEHYYQAMKTLDEDEREDIRLGYLLGTSRAIKINLLKGNIKRDSSPGYAKKQGGNVMKLREDWEEVKEDVMRKALRAKFEIHAGLREKLLSTGDATLIEASPGDYYWGEGQAKIGKNRLGVLLMELREALRK